MCNWGISACPLGTVPVRLGPRPYVPGGAFGGSSSLEYLGPLASPKAPWESTVQRGGLQTSL